MELKEHKKKSKRKKTALTGEKVDNKCTAEVVGNEEENDDLLPSTQAEEEIATTQTSPTDASIVSTKSKSKEKKIKKDRSKKKKKRKRERREEKEASIGKREKKEEITLPPTPTSTPSKDLGDTKCEENNTTPSISSKKEVSPIGKGENGEKVSLQSIPTSPLKSVLPKDLGDSNEGEQNNVATSVSSTNEIGSVEKQTQEIDEGDAGDGVQKKKRKRKRKRKKNSTSAEEPVNPDGDGISTDLSKEDKYSSLDYTVFVEGIPYDCEEEEVRDFFVKNSCEDVIQLRLARWQDSGRLRGYGHVVFDTLKSRAMALSDLNGLNLRQRYLSIRPPNQQRHSSSSVNSSPPTQPTGCKTIFVKNLPYNSSEEDIQLTFRPFGKIINGGVRLARNYSTGQFKGFAYVEFKNPEGAYAAIQRGHKTNGIIMNGRCCFVDYEEGQMKGSYRGNDGKLWQKEHGSVHNNNES